MEKTVVGIFTSRDTAENAAHQIKYRGLRMDDISIVAKAEEQTAEGRDTDAYVNDNISDGLTAGGILGGLAGLLIGAGAFALPGLGVIVAAGPIAGLLSGAVTGGIVGGLVDLGVPEEESRRYEEEVKQGNYLLTMRQDETKVNEVAEVLRQFGATEVNVH